MPGIIVREQTHPIKRYDVLLGGWDARERVPEKDVLAVPASNMGVLLLTAAERWVGNEHLVRLLGVLLDERLGLANNLPQLLLGQAEDLLAHSMRVCISAHL